MAWNLLTDIENLDIFKAITLLSTIYAVSIIFIKIYTSSDFDRLFLTKDKKTIYRIIEFGTLFLSFYFLMIVTGLGFTNWEMDTIKTIVWISFFTLITTFILLFIYYLILKVYNKDQIKKQTNKKLSFNNIFCKSLFYLNYPSMFTLICLVISTFFIQYNDGEIVLSSLLTSLIMVGIMIIFFGYGYISMAKTIFNLSPKKHIFIFKKISNEILGQKGLIVLYSLDSDTLVLGDADTELESNYLYHYKKSTDSLLLFEKVKVRNHNKK